MLEALKGNNIDCEKVDSERGVEIRIYFNTDEELFTAGDLYGAQLFIDNNILKRN